MSYVYSLWHLKGSDDKLRQLAATAACARLVLACVAHCRDVTHSVHVTVWGLNVFARSLAVCCSLFT